jgi:hypothetical protein
MRTKGSAQGGARERFVVTEAERRVLTCRRQTPSTVLRSPP